MSIPSSGSVNPVPNAQRLAQRKAAHADGAWVRAAALAHAEANHD